jgi:hypothetical protein
VPRDDLGVDRAKPDLQVLQLPDDHPKRRAHQVWNPLIIPVTDHGDQLGNVPHALWHDDPDLGEVATKRVDQRRPLPNQQITRPMKHQH